MVIFKANNAVSFSVIKVINNNQDGFTAISGIQSIATTTIGSSTYALAAAANSNGVQIINITTPGSPIAASAVINGTNYPSLLGPVSITTTTIGSSTYALVVSSGGNRVHIVDITDPYAPTPTSILLDHANSLKLLSFPRSIATTTINSSTYALVVSQGDHAVSIVNITTPSAPTTASVVSDGTKYKNLNNPYSITTTTIGSSTYALVAANGDNGVQVIDITNPYAPDDASSYQWLKWFYKVGDPVSITTIAGSPEYALVMVITLRYHKGIR